jgi:hypothetical protein
MMGPPAAVTRRNRLNPEAIQTGAMRPRELFLLFSLASFAVAMTGWILRVADVDPMAGGPVFIALLMSAGFLTAAWYVGKIVGSACVACGMGPVLTVGFCAKCGERAEPIG